MQIDPQFYAVAVPAVTILGLSKGGFVGLGNLAIPMMALAIAPVHAAAVLLPILIIQDAISIFSYRGTWDKRNLMILLPGAMVGIGLGYLLAAYVSDAGLGLCVGIISVVFGLRRLIVERSGPAAPVKNPNTLFGLLCGAVSGFTSMIAHAGGPPFQIYVMPQRLPREVLVGTTVMFFAAVNIIKIVPYFVLGQFTSDHLMLSATLIPVAIASTWVGIWLVRRITSDRFYTIIYILMVVIGLKLIWDNTSTIIA